MFTPRISLTPLCRGLGGLEGSCQHALLRNSTIRKTFSSGMASIRRHSQCIAVKLQAVSKTVLTLFYDISVWGLFFSSNIFFSAGCSGKSDPPNKTSIPAVRVCTGGWRKFRHLGSQSAAALHSDPDGASTLPYRLELPQL